MSSPQPDPHDPIHASGPNPIVVVLKTILKVLASLRLTVTLLALGLILVFFGTLAQKTAGMWTVVDKYFWSRIVLIDAQPTIEFLKIFFNAPKDWQAPTWARVPFPGGKIIGGLMFINLLAAHATRFKLTWKRAGIWMAHGGLLLLFVGEYITREFQVEQRMTIPQGESVNYAEDARKVELAFVTREADGTQRVTVVPGARLVNALESHETITHPELPVDIRVESYMANSAFYGEKNIEFRKSEGLPIPENPATAGLGLTDVVERKDEVSGVGEQSIDLPSAYVTLYRKGTEEKLGTYLVSLWYTYNPFERDEQKPKQSVKVDGTSHDFALRYTRYYKPYSLYLREFRFDRYTGTEQAKNYSSDLILIDRERGQERDVHIEMNDPLRYRGETFYQSNFDKTTEKTTILQVVRNPGWLLPYFACAMVGIGLLFHFVLGLTQYLTRLKKASAANVGEPPTMFERVLPWGAVGLGALMLLGAAMPRSYSTKPELVTFARMPVVDGGRVKPLDTVARVYLRKISGREEFLGPDNRMHPAIEWLMDSMASQRGNGPAFEYKVIRIENEQVLSLLGLERREGYRYSLNEVAPKLDLLSAASQRAKPREGAPKPKADENLDRFFESGDRDVFAGQVLETADRIQIYTKLCARAIPLTLPPAKDKDLDWRSLGDLEFKAERAAFFMVAQETGLTPEVMGKLSSEERKEIMGMVEQKKFDLIKDDPAALLWGSVISAYKSGNPENISRAISTYQKTTEAALSGGDRAKARFEVFLNEFAPTYQVIYLYTLVGLLALAGWVAIAFRPALGAAFQKSAFWLLVLAFVIHGFALFARMYLMDRPLVFVTNLYSTAVFIGWAAVGLGLVLERIAPIGLGNLAASVVGGGTAIIAHNLATSGDTLEMMQAVLDTNFWLATHVTTINLGYAATYVAGVIGIVYIMLGLFTPMLTRTVGLSSGPATRNDMLGRVLGQLMYGVLCLATLLSFVGTVLGGIWADQSWGRFWGWDPKENGAVLIVIWNALILHARWCGLVKDRGIAVLSLVGNMVTTWSYFGTNQLGVGLHAYGFSNTLATGCTITWVGHTVLIGMGCIPLRFWRSFADPAATAAAATATDTTSPAATAAPATDAVAPVSVTPATAPAVNGTNGQAPTNGDPKPGPGKGKRHKKR